MDCRIARTLIVEPLLRHEEEKELAYHLEQCTACRDDLDDPVGRVLLQSNFPLVHPPPTFTRRVMTALPPVAPAVIYRRALVRRWLPGFVGALLVALAAWLLLTDRFGIHQPSSMLSRTLTGPLTPSFRIVLRLLLISKGLMVLAQPAVALPVIVVAILGVAGGALAFRWTRRAPAFALCALALAVVLNGLPTLRAHHVPMSIQGPIVISTPADGDILSLTGDIKIESSVKGDVITLGGHVLLLPGARVDGSILAGKGATVPLQAVVAGTTVDGLAPGIGGATVVPGTTTAAQGSLEQLAVQIALLLLMVLTALWLLLQLDQSRRAGLMLAAQPGLSVLVGAGMAVSIAGLALATSIVAAAFVAGIVLLPIVVVAFHVPFIQGNAVVAVSLGRRLGGPGSTPAIALVIGVEAAIVLGIALISPLWSLVAFYLLGSPGLGAILLGMQHPLVPR